MLHPQNKILIALTKMRTGIFGGTLGNSLSIYLNVLKIISVIL
jgi:hypothetical protein